MKPVLKILIAVILLIVVGVAVLNFAGINLWLERPAEVRVDSVTVR